MCVWGHRGGQLPSAPTPTPQAKNERNYHIFYELLAGLPAQLRQAFSLQEAETYYYLNQVSAGRCLRALACPLLCRARWAEAARSWPPPGQRRYGDLGA